MKILIVSPSFFPATYYGGPIQSTYELAKALIIDGNDGRVITTNANGKEKLEVKTGVFHKLENELPVKYFKSLDSRGISLPMLFNLKSEIKKADIVYLISIFSPPTPFVIHYSKKLNIPLIISPKGQLGKWCLEQGSTFKKIWLRLFIQPITQAHQGGQAGHQSFYWHLTSEEEEKSVLSVYSSAKTFVIPNGVNSELFSLNDKPKHKSFYNKYTGFDCAAKKIIVSMGRLHKVKGFDILIEAVNNVQSSKFESVKELEGQDVVLFIAGEDFGERKNLEQLIDKLGLNEKVFLVGKIEGSEKIEFLRNADVFALASHHENFGIVYAEALASGTPVVASKNTPWQDVEKYNCGKWVENTPEKFADSINQILDSDTEQMGENGRKYIEENFSSEKITELFIKQLKLIMNERNANK